MQIAIRRVLPNARQRIACSLKYTPSTIHLRIRKQSRHFSHTLRSLLNSDNLTRTIDSNENKSVKKSDVGNKIQEVKEEDPVIETHNPTEKEQELQSSEIKSEEAVNETSGGNGGSDGAEDRPIRRGRPVGAKTRRTIPPVKIVEVEKPVLPKWFIEKSIQLKEENSTNLRPRQLGIYSSLQAIENPVPSEVPVEPVPQNGTELNIAEEVLGEIPEGILDELPNEALERVIEAPTQHHEKKRYQLHESVWQEIKTQIRTGLLLPKGSFMDSLASIKSHCLLHLPREGGVYYLDALVDELAAEVDADLIRMEAQDFAEIAGDYIGDSRHSYKSDISSFGIRSLGYDTQISPTDSVSEAEESGETTDDTYEDDDVVVEGQDATDTPNIMPLQALQQLLRSGRIASIMPFNGDFSTSALSKDSTLDRLNERKMNHLLDTMVCAAQSKRLAQVSPATDPTSEPIAPTLGKTLIHIRDYRQMERTTSGRAILDILHNIVQDRRKQGERIVILGTSSVQEEHTRYNKAGVRYLQSHSPECFERTIVVPTVFGEFEDKIFSDDHDARIREVNIRHLRDVIQRRSGENGEAATLEVPDKWHLIPEVDLEIDPPGLSDKVWTFDYVHRVVSVALGSHEKPPSTIYMEDIESAVRIIQNSDKVKFEYATQQSKFMTETDSEEGKPKMTKIPKSLTNHEKKLVGGIIEPENIHTGFSSVRAPPETIESMKILTSLSLIRPEAFKYGVLATDRIPGVLLYGPPGTGKTLLAKAVAKESGATVLEVSGADIADMFVGESEKNVKAIFSLAKKLSPCVVFIDEADAIFGTRQSLSSRSSHRETINQFLKEWADMTSTAFIMVATNRPFDLDDAVLRRLPRRILIDLPTPEDRLAILKIHLAAETLDDNVNLKNIAESASLYSGSDLKNICVSAALTCVREEHAHFKKTGSYPEKRILRKGHFEKAFNEISASISDDMGSLSLIRKFDDKYGEKAGRKKKSAWGFEQGQSDAHPRGEGRVRID